MKHTRYIIDENEIELLDRVDGTGLKNSNRYDDLDKGALVRLCQLKDRSNDMFARRYQAAREVIDLVAESIGIDPGDCGFWLYALDYDGGSPLIKRIDEWCSRSGDKVKLKRRVQELEQENSLLRSLFQK